MDLDAIEIFVKVVQAGSFTRAAHELGIPTTTASSKVARLEKRLRTTLIQRTTRKLHVTPAGQAYFERCVRGLDEITGGEADLESRAKEAAGVLRITAATDVAHTLLVPLIRKYLDQHPKVSTELVITSRFVDLVSEGIDLAIRLGPLKDSSSIARPFASARAGLWASEDYLAARRSIRRPRDLENHQLVVFGPAVSRPVVLSRGSQKHRFIPKGRIFADEPGMLRLLAVLGDGIALLPEFLARGNGVDKPLVQVLPGWHIGRGDERLWLVYPAQRFMPPKVRAFLDLIESKFSFRATAEGGNLNPSILRSRMKKLGVQRRTQGAS